MVDTRPIIGGTIGGVIGLAIIILLIIGWRQRKQEDKAAEEDYEAGRPPKGEKLPKYKQPIDISSPQQLPAHLAGGSNTIPIQAMPLGG
ncbi:hypothetical protein DFP72DRAFT_1164274 [Ephemerocybe angulata]|uniref:Uncharacterized protein n=1 Tax=Ephemerocybe angulata TaxID=980116 RepID=A0A8H6ID53_9AGAR|nr:hypothetical protein DFP72DRAFT_1164274 [Tulosesus angulatus]